LAFFSHTPGDLISVRGSWRCQDHGAMALLLLLLLLLLLFFSLPWKLDTPSL
jgi:hypothetical protein